MDRVRFDTLAKCLQRRLLGHLNILETNRFD